MRTYVENQLKKCILADLKNFDAATNTFYISKYTKPTYDVNKCYLVQVAPYFINNTGNVIATNWNKGTAPKNTHLKIYVSKIMGKMIYVDSIGFNFETKEDTANMWSGWVSIDDITQLALIG